MSLPKTRIQKGKELENHIIDEIVKRGLGDSSNRTPGSGSGKRDKRDINTGMMVLGRTAGIECKNYKNHHIQEWWEQTKKLEEQGYEPILAYKLGGEGYGETKVVIYLSTFLDLVANQNKTELQTGIPNQDKWLVKRAIDNLKDVHKILEKYGK